jgi:hypothetical protein
MLAEIEAKLVEILREKVTEVPRENLFVNAKPVKVKLPALIISNLDFCFENAALAENIDGGKNEVEERFGGDNAKKSFKLREKPLRSSVHVEYPRGTVLVEDENYTVDYKVGSVDFRQIPMKGTDNIVVKYSTTSLLLLKSLKVKAHYAVDVWGADWTETDSLAEKVIRAFLLAEDKLVAEGIELKPVDGAIANGDESKIQNIRLRYILEKILRVEETAGPMEKIEIKEKNL